MAMAMATSTCILVLLVSTVHSAPIVQTAQGLLKGFTLDTVDRFLGVPFAAPPVGNLRFMPPAPALPWTGVRDALVNGDDCLSTHSDYIKVQNTSENCLFLNIWRPSSSGTTPLPVMVFFYGGSFAMGGSSFPLYDGGSLVRTGNVIVVTVNYRLGPFGFLGSTALAARSGSTGNYGIQDQRASLVWVRDNIANFGGDPASVTIFGESAGGGSIVNHLVMPNSSGLFVRAIMESGPPADWSAMPLAQAEQEFVRLVAGVNCSDSADVVACLLTVPALAIIQNQHSNDSLLLEWAPVIDNVELIAAPQDLWASHHTNPVTAILLGSNTDEGTNFDSDASWVTNASDFEKYVYARYGKTLGAAVLPLYPFESFAAPGLATSMVWGDSLMACPARRGATWMTQKGTSAYLYHFEKYLEVLKKFDPKVGVMHAAEIPVVFGFSPLLWTENEQSISRATMKYWTNFARNGVPGDGDIGTSWPEFTLSGNEFLALNTTIAAGVHLKAAQCDLWDRVFLAKCQVLTCPCNCDIF